MTPQGLLFTATCALFGASLVMACDKSGGDARSTTPSSTSDAVPSRSSAPKTAASASATPAASASATPAASASAASASGDPFAGAPADPGDEAPIPYAKGYVVVAPKGWKVEGHERGADTVVTPPTGKGKIVFAGTASGSALELRVSDFLKDTTTAGVAWDAETKTKLGVGALESTVARGKGSRTLPNGDKEVHQVLRVMVKTDLKDLEIDVNGKAIVTIQALAEWGADEPDFEKGAIEAIKSIKKKE